MKHTTSKFAFTTVFIVSFLIGFAINFPAVDITDKLFVTNAEAAGPASPHGATRRTARRTSRRVTRRHVARGTRVHALPGGCTTVLRGGVKYHHCGGVYYQPYYEGDQVVYVVVDEP